jgi:hypothetical protein
MRSKPKNTYLATGYRSLMSDWYTLASGIFSSGSWIYSGGSQKCRPNSPANSQTRSNFQKQQKSYFDFKEKVEQDTLFTDALPNLDASEEKELKSLYREALFMAHPDHSMTMRQKKPGPIRSPQPSRRPTGKKTWLPLREIWQSLQDGFAFDLQAFDQADAGKWLKYYEKLLLRKQELLIEIDVLKANELYPYVANNTGVDEYAEQVASHLNLKIEIIQKEIKTYE